MSEESTEKERKLVIYNSLFNLFLDKQIPEKILKRYIDNSEEDTDDESFVYVQDFVGVNMKKEIKWSTSLGIMEAIDHMIDEAIGNGNLTEDFISKM